MGSAPVVCVVAAITLALPLAGCTGSTPGPTPSSSTTVAPDLTPAAFGAVGDGSADDTAALQRALDALAPGQALRLEDGKVYRHTDILTVSRPGSRVLGTGTLLATNEDRSEVLLTADDVLLEGPTLKVASTTKRGESNEQMKLRLADHSGIVVRDVTIDGASAAGVYVGTGVSNFLLENLSIHDTRADGIHITSDAHDGVVRNPVVDRSGDDGVAVVSYQRDRTPVKRILVESPTVRDQVGGRGVSVVGGEDITYRNVTVRASSSAAVYVASEGAPYYTFAPTRVSVEGATLEGSNTAAGVDHGAFLVYAGNPGAVPTDISASNVTITGTRLGATSQVGVRADAGCSVANVRLSAFTITGGGNRFSANVPPSTYTLLGWSP